MIDAKRLGLGTVQFGMDYGISNPQGQVAEDKVQSILHRAFQTGIKVLDTAAEYGNAERALGHSLRTTSHFKASDFRIITKIQTIREGQITPQNISTIKNRFQTSLSNLSRSHVDTLMVHHADDLLVPGGDAIYALLQELKDKGTIKKIGVSIYDQEQLDRLLSLYEFDVIQLPINIFDQKLLQAGSLAHIKRAGLEIHARSIFLQGLLLMDTDAIPDKLVAIRPYHEAFRRTLSLKNYSPLAACLGFIMNIPEIDIALVGVTNLEQLQQIIETPCIDAIDYTPYTISDSSLIDPRQW